MQTSWLRNTRRSFSISFQLKHDRRDRSRTRELANRRARSREYETFQSYSRRCLAHFVSRSHDRVTWIANITKMIQGCLFARLRLSKNFRVIVTYTRYRKHETARKVAVDFIKYVVILRACSTVRKFYHGPLTPEWRYPWRECELPIYIIYIKSVSQRDYTVFSHKFFSTLFF